MPSLRLGVAIFLPDLLLVLGPGERAGEDGLNSKLEPLIPALLPNRLEVSIAPFDFCSVEAGAPAVNEKEVVAGIEAFEAKVEVVEGDEKILLAPWVPFVVSDLKLLKIWLAVGWLFAVPNPAALAEPLIEFAPKRLVVAGFSLPNIAFFAIG